MSVRTPALLSMFSKDPISMALAQGALKSIALLEPNLVMPDIIERAYSGLEVVNETHRTTAVLSTLAGVTIPLVSEKIWLGGQKHVLPLLELSLPGIDLVRFLPSFNRCSKHPLISTSRMIPPRLYAPQCSLRLLCRPVSKSEILRNILAWLWRAMPLEMR